MVQHSPRRRDREFPGLFFICATCPWETSLDSGEGVGFQSAVVGSAQSVFEKWFAGSTGDPPVPSGDSPDGTGAIVRGKAQGLFATLLAAVPVGGSPTGAGGSPAPPIFKTGSQTHRAVKVWILAQICIPPF